MSIACTQVSVNRTLGSHPNTQDREPRHRKKQQITNFVTLPNSHYSTRSSYSYFFFCRNLLLLVSCRGLGLFSTAVHDTGPPLAESTFWTNRHKRHHWERRWPTKSGQAKPVLALPFKAEPTLSHLAKKSVQPHTWHHRGKHLGN